MKEAVLPAMRARFCDDDDDIGHRHSGMVVFAAVKRLRTARFIPIIFTLFLLCAELLFCAARHLFESTNDTNPFHNSF